MAAIISRVKKYGPKINIKAKNFDKIIKWGQKKHGDTTED